jgi:hypothetical protein
LAYVADGPCIGFYTLDMVDKYEQRIAGIFSAPSTSYLATMYPNPFNSTTTISLTLPQNSSVEFKVYDPAGCLVCSAFKEYQIAGKYNMPFDGSDLASGVYIYRLRADDFTAQGKMILLK